ncbi:MAG: DMT family transporter [Deinococcales bacterium]
MLTAPVAVPAQMSKAWLLALSTSFLFSAVVPLSSLLLQRGLEPLSIMLLRYTLVSVLLIISMVAQPKYLKISLNTLGLCLLCGLLYFVSVFTYTTALTHLSASVATILLPIYPLIVLILLAFRGEKLNSQNLLRLLLGFLGVYIIIGPGGQVNMIGVLLMFTCCLSYALYLVIMQWFLKDKPVQSITFYVMLTITALTLINWLALHVKDLKQALPPLSPSSILAILIIAIIGTYLAQLALFKAVQLLGSAQIALLGPLEILLTLLWSALLLHESLSPLQMLGGLLILASMVLALFRLKHIKRLWRSTVRWRI